jgi:hypothetical protein
MKFDSRSQRREEQPEKKTLRKKLRGKKMVKQPSKRARSC